MQVVENIGGLRCKRGSVTLRCGDDRLDRLLAELLRSTRRPLGKKLRRIGARIARPRLDVDSDLS